MSKERGMNVTKLIPVDGQMQDIEARWGLAESQKYVGGYIERVPTTVPHRLMIVNEEGYLEGLPSNWMATAIVRPGTLLPPGGIRGNAFLVKA